MDRERYLTPGPGHVGFDLAVDAGPCGLWRGRIRAITPLGVIVATTAQWIVSGTAGWVSHPKENRHLAGGRIDTGELIPITTITSEPCWLIFWMKGLDGRPPFYDVLFATHAKRNFPAEELVLPQDFEFRTC